MIHRNQVRAGTGRVRPMDDFNERQRNFGNQQQQQRWNDPGSAESGVRRHGTSQRRGDRQKNVQFRAKRVQFLFDEILLLKTRVFLQNYSPYRNARQKI